MNKKTKKVFVNRFIGNIILQNHDSILLLKWLTIAKKLTSLNLHLTDTR